MQIDNFMNEKLKRTKTQSKNTNKCKNIIKIHKNIEQIQTRRKKSQMKKDKERENNKNTYK